MTINKRQFEQLTEMGISLWQTRLSVDSNDTVKDKESNYIAVELNDISQKQIFKDIIQCLNISIGEIITLNDHLDLGLFNWYFTNKKKNKAVAVKYINNNLITPTISTIAQSASLKKQLWLTIKNDLL